MNRYDVRIKDASSGELVPAALLQGVDAAYVAPADAAWAGFVEVARNKAVREERVPHTPEDGQWDWHEKAKSTAGLLSYELMAVESAGEAQGLMLLRLDGTLGLLNEHAGKPVVAIEYLATAPWNRPEFKVGERYRGVGNVLMRAAVERSLELEFKGRVALHSLPAAVGFYERCGMMRLGAEHDKNSMPCFEFTAERAAAFRS